MFVFSILGMAAKQANIVVDVGNSFIKSAKFVADELMDKQIWTELAELKAHYATTNYHWIFSSVGNKGEQIAHVFHDTDFILLNATTPVPIVLDYDTPETLGMDRVAAAVGAFHLFRGKATLIIDAGSCITYDIVDRGVYKGGQIAPGLRMRMRAMNHFTSKLPDISEEWQKVILRLSGRSTREGLLGGAYGGMIHEINGFIDQYLKEYGDLAVILTGGDAVHFESKLKAPIFANLNLVLIGLNRILNHNK